MTAKPKPTPEQKREMGLMARYRRLTLSNQVGLWAGIAVIAGLAIRVWPTSSSPPTINDNSVVQNVSSSPNSVNVAAQTVVFGKPPMPENELRDSYRKLLTSINPVVTQGVDAGQTQMNVQVSQTNVRKLEELGQHPSATNYLTMVVHGPGPIVIGSGNRGNGIWDQLQDGQLMSCTFLFTDRMRNLR